MNPWLLGGSRRVESPSPGGDGRPARRLLDWPETGGSIVLAVDACGVTGLAAYIVRVPLPRHALCWALDKSVRYPQRETRCSCCRRIGGADPARVPSASHRNSTRTSAGARAAGLATSGVVKGRARRPTSTVPARSRADARPWSRRGMLPDGPTTLSNWCSSPKRPAAFKNARAQRATSTRKPRCREFVDEALSPGAVPVPVDFGQADRFRRGSPWRCTVFYAWICCWGLAAGRDAVRCPTFHRASVAHARAGFVTSPKRAAIGRRIRRNPLPKSASTALRTLHAPRRVFDRAPSRAPGSR